MTNKVIACVAVDVETRQIATTILRALSINPKELAGAREEDTKALPEFE